jgi:hypothetical protein
VSRPESLKPIDRGQCRSGQAAFDEATALHIPSDSVPLEGELTIFHEVSDDEVETF